MPPSSFVCRGCGNPPDAPMLKDDVWEQVSAHYERGYRLRDLLCTECVEKALGRHIELDDLKDCLGNNFTVLIVTRTKKGLHNVSSGKKPQWTGSSAYRGGSGDYTGLIMFMFIVAGIFVAIYG